MGNDDARTTCYALHQPPCALGQRDNGGYVRASTMDRWHIK